MTVFEKRFNELCEEKQISYTSIANKLSFSPQAVYKWAHGISEPSINTINKLSKIFEVSIDYLIGEDNNKNARTNSKTIIIDEYKVNITMPDNVKHLDIKNLELIIDGLYREKLKEKDKKERRL